MVPENSACYFAYTSKSNRQQRVVVNGVKSDWAPVVSGVPQGTVLGPLLFSLHINDIMSDIESEIRLFADDCVCYREIKDIEDTLKLQKDIDRLGVWARKWGSGSTRPGTNSAPESTRPRVNSAGSTRPVYFPYGELDYNICT